MKKGRAKKPGKSKIRREKERGMVRIIIKSERGKTVMNFLIPTNKEVLAATFTAALKLHLEFCTT
jgi:uncharacterized membrane protein